MLEGRIEYASNVVVGIIIFLLLTYIGLTLLLFGRRGRRMNDHPICAACRFDLVGVYPDVQLCPECGVTLNTPKSVVTGARRPSRRMITLSVICLIMGPLTLVGTFGPVLAGRTWYHYMPTSMLIARAPTANILNVTSILSELTSRYRAGALRDRQIDAVVKTILAQQAKPLLATGLTHSWTPEWGDLFETLAAGGDVAPEDYATFVQQALSINAVAQTRTHPDPNLAFGISFGGYRCGFATQLYLEPVLTGLEIDGQPFEYDATALDRIRLVGPQHASTTTHIPLTLDVGTYRVNTTWTVRSYESLDANAKLLAEAAFTTSSDLEVLPTDQSIVGLVRDDWVLQEFRDELAIINFSATPLPDGAAQINFRMAVQTRRVALSMDLVLVAGGREWPLRTITIPRGIQAAPGTITASLDNFHATNAVLELHPNTAAAEELLGFEDILGETVSIPVTIEWSD